MGCPGRKHRLQEVVQYDSIARKNPWKVPVAEGVVRMDTHGELLVQVTRGRFECGTHPRAGHVWVGGQDCGEIWDVDAVGALSYKEVISSKPLKPLWYVSHFWGEPVFDFITCCTEHATRWGLEEKVASYWVCGYANRQYNLAEEICGDVEHTAFRRAMRLAKGALSVFDTDAVAFDRVRRGLHVFC